MCLGGLEYQNKNLRWMNARLQERLDAERRRFLEINEELYELHDENLKLGELVFNLDMDNKRLRNEIQQASTNPAP